MSIRKLTRLLHQVLSLVPGVFEKNMSKNRNCINRRIIGGLIKTIIKDDIQKAIYYKDKTRIAK